MSNLVDLVNIGNNAAMVIDRGDYGQHYNNSSVGYRQLTFTNNQIVHIANWGPLNKFPTKAMGILKQDPHAMQILRKKIQFLIGGGVIPYVTRMVDGKQKEVVVEDLKVRRFLDTEQQLLEKVLFSAGTNLEFFDSFAVEFFTNRAVNKVVSFQTIDATNFRLLKTKDGEHQPSESLIYRLTQNAADIRPLFDFRNPKAHTNFVLFEKYHEPGNPYYSTPPWWGAKSELDLRSLILDMMLKSMTNGWSLKYQLEVHESFYADCDNDPIKKKAKKRELVGELNKVLSAKDSVNNNLVTEMISDHTGKPYSGVKVHILNQSLIDTSITKLIELKQNAQPATFGIDIGLAGLEMNKNLSSGSEIRNKFMMHLALNTPVPRKMLLKILEVIKIINGWNPELKFKFKDIEITKLDLDKTAQRPVTVG